MPGKAIALSTGQRMAWDIAIHVVVSNSVDCG